MIIIFKFTKLRFNFDNFTIKESEGRIIEKTFFPLNILYIMHHTIFAYNID